jgi:hypothetical protein
MGGATTYDEYSITVSGGSVESLGSETGNVSVGVTDISGDSTIIGDVTNDQFQVNASDSRTFVGTVTFDSVTGFVGMDGSGNYYLYVVDGTSVSSDGLPASITAPPGTNGGGEWSLTTNEPGCYCAGTMIATPGGERRVESLVAGDLVLTANGAAMPVLWLGRSVISRRFADPVRVLPIRIMAGALGENLPLRDLLVSPGHALLIDGVLVHAGALVNGTSIVRESDAPPVFDYYHVELATHEVLLANGTPAESFLEGNEDLAFHNLAERPVVAVRPEEMPYPRAKSSRQVPRALRERLAARAAMMAPDLAAAA